MESEEQQSRAKKAARVLERGFGMGVSAEQRMKVGGRETGPG